MSTRRVLVAFGSDLVALIERDRYRGEEILALDAAALAIAIQRALPFSSMDDWIGIDGRLAARDRARRWAMEWRDGTDRALGAHMSAVDHEAMRWYWGEVALASVLAPKLVEASVESQALVHRPLRRCLYYEASDVFAAVLSRQAGTRLLSDRGVVRHAASSLRSRLRAPHAPRVVVPTTPTGRVVLVANEHERFRFKPIVRAIEEQMGLRVSVMPIPGEPEGARPRLFSAQWRSRRRVLAQQASTRAPQGSDLRAVMTATQFQFLSFRRQRWPALARALERWEDLWRHDPPKIVIVSALADAEAQLPALAARRLGIPTLALPHGVVMDPPSDTIAEFIACGTPQEVEVRRSSGIAEHRIRLCRDALLGHEYEVAPVTLPPQGDRLRVLCLLDPVAFPGFAMSRVSPANQLSALRAVDAVAGGIDLLVKNHPAGRDLELIAAAGHNVCRAVLPPDSDLDALLPAVDVVLAVNYAGSALVHALLASRPVILMWNDPLLRSERLPSPAALLRSCGQLVENEAELHAALADLDPSRLKAARGVSEAFARRWLSAEDSVPIGELVAELIAMAPGG